MTCHIHRHRESHATYTDTENHMPHKQIQSLICHIHRYRESNATYTDTEFDLPHT